MKTRLTLRAQKDVAFIISIPQMHVVRRIKRLGRENLIIVQEKKKPSWLCAVKEVATMSFAKPSNKNNHLKM